MSIFAKMIQPVIMFDGVCNLCNGFVQFAIRNDKKNKLLFSSLQSDFSQNTLKSFGLRSDYIDSLVFLKNEKIYTKSSAALRIAKELGGLWPVFFIFIIIPSPIRNFVYDFIAKNRYKWFGKKDSCMIPTAELRQRFL